MVTHSLSYQLRWAWNLTKGYRWNLSAVLFLELIAIVLSLWFVLESKHAVDLAMGLGSGSIKLTLLWVTIAVVGGVGMRLLAARLSEMVRLRMTIDVQQELTEGQMMSSWKFVKDWHTGDLMVRIQSDGNEVVQMLSQSAINFVVTLLRLIASFAFLWTMDPMLAFMIVAISPLFLFAKLYFRKMRKLSKDVKAAESNFGKVVQESLKFRMLVRALGLTRARKQKLTQSQEQLYALKKEQLNFSLFTQGVTKLTINGGYLLTFVWGVYRLQAGQISFGTMTAFLQLVGRVQSPILQSITFVPAFVRFRTSVDRLLELILSEKEVMEPSQRIPNPKRIVISELWFRYADHTLIDNLNAEINRGEPLAIIGSSGRGKTTLIRLLLALIKPDAGNIWIDDDRGRVALSNAHRMNIAYVPQGNTLFSGTIRENVAAGETAVTEQRIKEALRLACAEFVYALPDGLDTIVGESGYGLSEGQAQRIAIARAMMSETSIWLFDEITSALDTETAEQVVNRLMEAGKDKIILFVTHDLRLAEQCSQTIYMQ